MALLHAATTLFVGPSTSMHIIMTSSHSLWFACIIHGVSIILSILSIKLHASHVRGIDVGGRECILVCTASSVTCGSVMVSWA